MAYFTSAEQPQESDATYRIVPGIEQVALPLGIPILVHGMKEEVVVRTNVTSLSTTPYEGRSSVN